ncbi:uncharacterized protein FA14DRAFT_178007 [Meira miltonrushii]|uniref:Uncharacterized protein n=1 Tax=Meira miltonrushii TaxID=1280837 RepID=A0A316VAS4_9BASI|nr:uncharacterized protein FA14DRAFT_178007 [Meira miltonrushii]PWN34602.1 hypothetical protein FA14DRAFT_178007 [Meira miltonrushii]
MSKALPLILCGRHAHISRAASDALKPQFDESAKEEIPQLLHKHSSFNEQIAGVVFGGGFDQKSFDRIRASVWNYSKEHVPDGNLFTTWLRNDLKTKYHNNPLIPEKQELYGQEVGQRAKKRLLALLASGHLQPPKDKVYFF